MTNEEKTQAENVAATASMYEAAKTALMIEKMVEPLSTRMSRVDALEYVMSYLGQKVSGGLSHD